jgi:hypothetical protein
MVHIELHVDKFIRLRIHPVDVSLSFGNRINPHVKKPPGFPLTCHSKECDAEFAGRVSSVITTQLVCRLTLLRAHKVYTLSSRFSCLQGMT